MKPGEPWCYNTIVEKGKKKKKKRKQGHFANKPAGRGEKGHWCYCKQEPTIASIKVTLVESFYHLKNDNTVGWIAE